MYKTMLSCCLKCKKNKESKNPGVAKAKNRRMILFSKHSMCNSNKSKFLKERKARGTLTP